MRSPARPLAALLIAVSLTGCVRPDGRDDVTDPVADARGLPGAPDAVRDGEPSCGEFVLGQGDGIPTVAVECLRTAAVAGREAGLAWSVFTTEGDPIPHFAVVRPGDRTVTVFSTDAFDSFGGGQGWTEQVCPTAAVTEFGCAEEDAG